MRTWYIYRTFYLFGLIPKIGKAAFRFRKDRKSFDDSSTVRDYTFYWRDIAPIILKQVMVEAELTRKYKV